MNYDIAVTVLDKAVKYNMPPSDIAELINNIFANLEWSEDLDITIQDLIECVKFYATDKYSSCDKDAYNKWLELHG